MAKSSFPTPKILRHGSGQRLQLRGEVRHQLLDGSDSAGTIALAHSQFEAGSGAPVHLHTREDELFLVERGEFVFQIGEEKIRVEAGDFVFGPRLVPHAYKCESAEGGALYVAVLPGGFENFFREMSAQLEQRSELTPADMRAMAANFGVQIGEYDEQDKPGTVPRVVRATEGELLHAFGDRVRVQLSTDFVGGRFCVGELETPPHAGPPLHMHEREDELFLIRAGRFEFQIDGERVEVGVGDIVFAPRGVPHTYSAISDEPGVFLLIASPGGFDDFFRTAANLFASEAITPQSIEELSEKYGIRFLPEG